MADSVGKSVEFHTVNVDGTPVNFPFEPYDLQIEYMKKVLECVRDGRNGLLESPTGTGKTLSLLCSSLAWLEEAKAKKQLARIQAAQALNQASPDIVDMLTNRYKIIYSSRTHSQLSQAMSELAGTTYRYMKVSILGSRDQLCVNQAVMEAPSSRDKINMCQARVKAKTCVFHQNVEKNKEREEFREGKILDIEDLHKLGRKHQFCPYYMSKEMYQTADVIFLPYNYLLDEKTRKTLDLDLHDSVIIFDEAHNIQKLCEEAASVSITLADIALAIQDIDWISDGVGEQSTTQGFDDKSDLKIAAGEINESEMLAIKGFLLDIETRLAGLVSEQQKHLTRTGTFVTELFAQFKHPNVQHTMDLLMNYVTKKNEDGGISNKGRGLSKVHDLLSTAFNQNVTEEDLEKLYKVHIAKEEKKNDTGKGFLKSRSETVVLNLWCFSPGFSMKNLSKLGARSIILTSGTLSPLSAFQEEIGIPFPVQLENKHIISASQVWCGVVTHGPDGIQLNSSFKCRSDQKYLSSLGQSIINIMRVVPHGVLIFFPSYGLMNSTREFWQGCGLWTKMEAIKPLFLEPQRKEALPTVMREYYAAAKDRKGAGFLAVCRGKVAEGLDFADDNGRACIITGLPYPPFKDPRVELKRQFLDDELKRQKKGVTQQSMTGTKWYGLEAFRATNQAIGRVIRHSRDHGAIVFLDNRFSEQNARQNMSSWLQPFFQKHDQIGNAIKGLAGFFKTDSMVGKQREEIIAAQTALINKNNANKKRKRVDVRLDTASTSTTEEISLQNLAEIYKGEEVENKAPKTIYEGLSEAIGFNVGPPKNKLNEFRRPFPPAPMVGRTSKPKIVVKKRLKIVKGLEKSGEDALNNQTSPLANSSGANLPESSSSSSEPVSKTTHSKANEDMARSYVTLLKKTVTTAEFGLFKNGMKLYKQKEDLKELLKTLEIIMLKYMESRPQLLTGFKVFIKKHHITDFDKFCLEAKESAKEITQIMVKD